MLTTHNCSFPSMRQNSTLISLTCKMLYNRSLPGWLQTFWISTLLKLSFSLSDLNNSFLKYTTLLSLQATLLATLALFLMKSLARHVSTHFLIHLSAHLCHHHHSHHPSLQDQNLPFQQILPTLILLLPLDCLHNHGTGLIILLDLFLVHFFFNFSVCSTWWTKLATHQLFTAH